LHAVNRWDQMTPTMWETCPQIGWHTVGGKVRDEG
jgi:hypothetical protein